MRSAPCCSAGGVIMSNASEEFRNLAKNLSIPVTCSLMGLGAFPCDHPQWLGMLGMHGTYAANKAVSNADLLIAVGVRFDDRVTGRLSSFAPKATIVHIDIDPTSIHKNVNVRIPVVGDCRNSLVAIREHLAAREPLPWKERFAAWQGQLDEWRQEQPITWTPGETTIKPQEVIKAVDKITEGKAILTTEVGQHQMWAAQLYNFTEPRTLLTSGGLGTMGYGFPAAIGAQFAYPNKLVIDVSGDGSFQMNLQELITAVSNKLPVKVLLLNNGCLGMVRQLQDLFYGGRLNAVDIPDQPDFVKLAEAYGAEGYRVAKLEDLESHAPHRVCQPEHGHHRRHRRARRKRVPHCTLRGFAGRNAVAVRTLGREPFRERFPSLSRRIAFPSLFSTVGRPLGRPFQERECILERRLCGKTVKQNCWAHGTRNGAFCRRPLYCLRALRYVQTHHRTERGLL